MNRGGLLPEGFKITNAADRPRIMKSETKTSSFWELVRTVFYAILIALFVRTLFFEPFNIPSGSMIPTLLIGDYLFVSKFSYGYSRFSLPFGPPLFQGRIWPTLPERGDVVVFKLPADQKTDYVKRIIGLPGDRVQLVNGLLHINGEPVKRESAGEYMATNGFGTQQKFQQYIETLPNAISVPGSFSSTDESGTSPFGSSSTTPFTRSINSCRSRCESRSASANTFSN